MKRLAQSFWDEVIMPRLCVAASLGFLMLGLWLAGCSSGPVAPPLAGGDDYVFSHWDWCPDEPTAQCPYIRMNNDLYVLEPGGRISNGSSVDIWTRQGVVVEALSLEDE